MRQQRQQRLVILGIAALAALATAAIIVIGSVDPPEKDSPKGLHATVDVVL